MNETGFIVNFSNTYRITKVNYIGNNVDYPK